MIRWRTATLGELSKPKQWPIISKNQMTPTGFPLYSANGQVGFSATYTHEDPTILVGCRGSCGTVHVTPARAYANGNAMALDQLDTTKIDIRFLYWFLKKRGFSDVISGSSQPQITRQNIVRVEVPLPPLDDQGRIGKILDQSHALLCKRRKALQELWSFRQSKFKAMFGDPIVNDRDHPVAELNALIDPARPITYGILKPGPDTPGGTPYVRVVDMKAGRILTEQVRRTSPEIAHQYRRSSLRHGDLLISIRGHVGRMAFAPEELAGANITQDTARLAITEANAIFIRDLLEYPSSKRWLAERTRGAAVQGINLGDLKKFPVILPDREEQELYARHISQVEKLRMAGEKQLVGFESLFASLQHRAFAGEL